jgi:PAS domain S-box-containing protein
MKSSLSILLVEDSIADAQQVMQSLEESGYILQWERVETADQLHEALEKQTWDAILCDYSLPFFNAPSALQIVLSSGLDIPFIVVSGRLGEETAIEMMRAGAHDYVMKWNLHRLPVVIDRELAAAKQRREKTRVEEQASAITDAVQDAIIMIDPRGCINFWNPSAERMLGYTQQEALGKNLHELIAPRQYYEAFVVAFSKFKNDGSGNAVGRAVELNARRKNGSEFPIMLSLSALHRPDGWYAVGIIYDKTIQQQTEEELRKLSRAVECSPVSIVITDVAGNIEYVNKKFIEVTGYTYDEVKGKNPRILKSGETTLEEYKRLWEIVSAGGTWIGEFHNKKKNGELYWDSASISSISDLQGHISHYIAVKENITEKKKNEYNQQVLLGQLKTKNEEIEEALRRLTQMQEGLIQSEKMSSLGLLAAGIAHEINNPLAFITSNLNRFNEYFHDVRNLLTLWMESCADLDVLEQNREALAELEQATRDVELEFVDSNFEELMKHTHAGANRIKKIVEQLRGFAHISKLEFTPIDINQILDETIDLVWNELKYKVTISRDYAPSVMAECIAGEMQQVFVNLLINAAHAINEKGEVDLRTSATTEDVVIEITDTGEGIPKELQKKIFDPFFTTKPIGKGTGLGLWVVSTIIHNHKGSIIVDSEVGKGARFTIRIPIHHAEGEH